MRDQAMTEFLNTLFAGAICAACFLMGGGLVYALVWLMML